MAALDELERERIVYHLGYMSTSFAGPGSYQNAASVQYGIPRPVQTMFLLQQAMGLLQNPFAIERVRRILFTLDDIEDKLRSATCVLVAERLGDITLRGASPGRTYPDLLEREYMRWAKRLADVLGVPFYPYSARFQNSYGAGSIPVQS